MTMTDSGITVEVLSRKDFAQLKEFCKVCATKGYRNNTDFGRLKLNKIIPPYGQYWVVKRDNKIICLSGCHKFPEIDDTSYRILFRAVGLETRTGLSRYHFNSLPFYWHVRPQVEWIKKQGGERFFITTQTDEGSDVSGKMFRMDKVMHLLEKQGILKLETILKIGYTKEHVWELNYNEYLSKRFNKYV